MSFSYKQSLYGGMCMCFGLFVSFLSLFFLLWLFSPIHFSIFFKDIGIFISSDTHLHFIFVWLFLAMSLFSILYSAIFMCILCLSLNSILTFHFLLSLSYISFSIHPCISHWHIFLIICLITKAFLLFSVPCVCPNPSNNVFLFPPNKMQCVTLSCLLYRQLHFSNNLRDWRMMDSELSNHDDDVLLRDGIFFRRMTSVFAVVSSNSKSRQACDDLTVNIYLINIELDNHFVTYVTWHFMHI